MQFEFAIVLVSIIVGMAITEILATWGRLIRQRERVTVSWVHIGWMALVLLLTMQFWWSLWELHDWPDYTFFQYVASLLPFMTLVVLAFMLCPDLDDRPQQDLVAYFYANSRWLFLLAALFLVELIVTNPLLRGEPWIGANNGLRLLGLAVVLPLARTTRPRIHAAALAIAFGLFLTFIAVGG